jgi:hypothetical protein
VGDDCPIFDGLFEYCSISAGGSMGKNLFLTGTIPTFCFMKADVISLPSSRRGSC